MDSEGHIPHEARRWDKLFSKWADLTVRHPWVILLLVALTAAPFLRALFLNIDVNDNSQGIWFPKEDLANAYYEDVFKKEFESDEMVVAAVYSEAGVFEPDTLALVQAIELAFEKIPDIQETISILSMNHVRGEKTVDASGEAQYDLQIQPVFPEGAAWTPGIIAQAKERALSDENFRGNVISPDGKFTAIFGRIALTRKIDVKAEITEKVKTALRRIDHDFAAKGAVFSDSINPLYDHRKGEFDAAARKIYLAGVPVVDYEFDHLAEIDQKQIMALSFAAIFTVLLVLFRSLAMALLPLLVMLLSIAFAFGGYALAGGVMNMLVGMGGPVLIAACVGESVHFLTTYYGERRPGVTRAEALRATILDVYWPCFFTAFTTALGFLSFAITYMPPMAAFGLTTAAGCFVSYIFSMTVIPAAIVALDQIESWAERQRGRHPAVRLLLGPVHLLLTEPDTKTLEKINNGPIRRMLGWIALRVTRHWKPLLATFILISLATVAGIARVRVETNNLEFIPKTHYVRYAMEAVQKRLTGLSNIEVVLEGDPGFANDPEVLRGVEGFVTELKAHPGIAQVIGPTSYLKQINKAMNGDDPAFYKLPESRELAAQYLLLAELSGDKDLKKLLNYDYSKIHLSIRSTYNQSSEFKGLLRKVEDAMRRHLPRVGLVDFGKMQDTYKGRDPAEAVINTRKAGEAPQYKLTGLISLYGRLDGLFVSELLFSFFQAFLEIYLCMAVLTRSFKMGAIAMLPNLFPIFITGAFMGLAGFPLDAATILIASVALGIAVDDTVHYVSRMPHEFKKSGGDYAKAIQATHSTIGRALVATSVILIVGFAVMMFGSFSPTRNFGMLTAITMFLAIWGEMIYTPVFYMAFKPLGPGKVAAPPQTAAAG